MDCSSWGRERERERREHGERGGEEKAEAIVFSRAV